MSQFFFTSRNIIGLILVISPVSGFLFIDNSFPLFMTFLCCAALSIPILTAAFKIIRFKLWLVSCCIFSCYGFMLMEMWEKSPLSYVGAALFGIGVCGLIIILPPNIVINWFRLTKTSVLGVVWSSSLSIGLLLRFLPEGNTYLTILISFLVMMVGALFFLERPPVNFQKKDNPLISGRTYALLKPKIFIFSISLTIGLAGCMICSINDTTLIFSLVFGYDTFFSLIFQLVSFALSPVLISLFIEKKGIFSGCILSIFLCEASILSIGWSVDYPYLMTVGKILCGAAISGILVIIPILTCYLYGPANYVENFSKIFFFCPLGIVCAVPFTFMIDSEIVKINELTVIMLLLLILSFFCIFSAWKRRMILLKNKIM